MSDRELRLCFKCKQLLDHTGLEHFEHMKMCKGIDPNAPIGITWMKWPPPLEKKSYSPTICIETVMRPVTR